MFGFDVRGHGQCHIDMSVSVVLEERTGPFVSALGDGERFDDCEERLRWSGPVWGPAQPIGEPFLGSTLGDAAYSQFCLNVEEQPRGSGPVSGPAQPTGGLRLGGALGDAAYSQCRAFRVLCSGCPNL